MRKLSAAFFAILLSTFSAPAEDLDPLTLLRENCVSCHTESKRKGGLLIDSRESLLKGGDTDAAIVPGKANESFLVETLFPDANPHMPPKEQLEPRAIAALEKWINDGAKWDAEKWARLNLPEKFDVTRGQLPEQYEPVFAVAISPDNKTLVAGRGELIDWYTLKPDEGDKPVPLLEYRSSSKGHADAVQSLAFSPDGKTLVSGGFRSIKFWNPAAPEKPVKEITAPFLGRLTALLYLKNPDRLLAADSFPSQIGRLHVIDLKTDQTTTYNSAHRDSIFDLSLSPDEKSYATASADKIITIRNSADHKIVKRLEGHTSYVIATAFNPDGTRLASVGDDEEVKVWDLKSGKKISSFVSYKSGPFHEVAWLIDPANKKKKDDEKNNEKKKAINTDRIVTFTESGRPDSFTDLLEHEGSERSKGAKARGFDAVNTPLFSMAYHPEKQWFFAGGENGKLYVWDENGKLKQTIEHPIEKPVKAPAEKPKEAPPKK